MIKKMVLQLEKDECIPQCRAKLPQDEMIPKPSKDYAVVFKNSFAYGLRLPSIKFLRQVLKEFEV